MDPRGRENVEFDVTVCLPDVTSTTQNGRPFAQVLLVGNTAGAHDPPGSVMRVLRSRFRHEGLL